MPVLKMPGQTKDTHTRSLMAVSSVNSRAEQEIKTDWKMRKGKIN